MVMVSKTWLQLTDWKATVVFQGFVTLSSRLSYKFFDNLLSHLGNGDKIGAQAKLKNDNVNEMQHLYKTSQRTYCYSESHRLPNDRGDKSISEDRYILHADRGRASRTPKI